MIKLLKADFFRIKKSKLTLIILIIAVVLPLLTSLMYLGINSLPGLEENPLGNIFVGKTIIGGSYSISNNFGLVLVIFSAIFVGMDLSNGTLRNKIIAGNDRVKIYFSHLITSTIFNTVLISIYTLCTTLFTLLFFDYGVKLDSKETLAIVYFVLTGTLTFIFIASVSTFFALVTKSQTATILFTILVCIVFSIITTVLQVSLTDDFKNIAYFIPTFTNTLFVYGINMTTKMFIEGILSYLIFGGLITFLGVYLFKEQDLK